MRKLPMTNITPRQHLSWRYFQAQRVLIESGLLPGSQDYTRFIILARARTGSKMLLSALDNHPQIVSYGEMFQRAGQMRWHPRYGHTPSPVAGEEAWTATESMIFRPYPAPIKAVGFKLFYYHARDEAWSTLWQGLQADKALHIIHVRRANMLDMAVSRVFAERREEWSTLQGEAGPATERKDQVNVDYEFCLQLFEETRSWQLDAQAFFAEQPWLEVTYENMADDFTAESRRVQDFLGLDYADITPKTLKQAQRTLPERVANYDELKAAFAGTEWSRFFTD
jgi:LPS sulfotransferase NodH